MNNYFTSTSNLTHRIHSTTTPAAYSYNSNSYILNELSAGLLSTDSDIINNFAKSNSIASGIFMENAPITTRAHASHTNGNNVLLYVDVQDGGGGGVDNNGSKMTTIVGNEQQWEDEIAQSVYTQIVIVFMYVLIIVVAVGGNLLFAFVIVVKQKIWSVTNLFLLNLAVSDVLKALVCNPFSFMANVVLTYWPYNETMCPLVTYVQIVTVFLSAFTLVAMSVDRYLAILRPLRPKMSKTAFAFTMLVIWVVSLATPLPTAIVSRVQYGENESKGLCLEVFDSNYHRSIYSVMIMVLQYFLPLAVITVTNTHIGYIVWIKKTPGEAEQDRDQRMAASKRRLIKMIIICVVIYAICWLPLHAITLAGDMNPDIYSLPHMNIVWTVSHWLAMSHSCYNPIVYFSLNANFRRNLTNLCRVCKHRRLRLNNRNAQMLKRRFSQQDSFRSLDMTRVSTCKSYKSSCSTPVMSKTVFISSSPRQHYSSGCY